VKSYWRLPIFRHYTGTNTTLYQYCAIQKSPS